MRPLLLGITYPTLGGHHRVPDSEIDRLIPQEPLPNDMQNLRGYLTKISGRNQLIGRALEVKYDGLVAQVTLAIGAQLHYCGCRG